MRLKDLEDIEATENSPAVKYVWASSDDTDKFNREYDQDYEYYLIEWVGDCPNRLFGANSYYYELKCYVIENAVL